MQIHGPVKVHGPQVVNAPHQNSVSRPQAVNGGLQQVDQLDISDEARAASEALETAPMRHERVAEIRTQIANGTYETSEKLEAAFDRLLDELG
ncbi:MAG: flagellar biosynthesis protein FlgM [Planctomycetaceae bacterium]|jgi:anti-sigma28 factor (negative regulator of flagellin synthesis)|nr:flagellar biosynthesis protein FlgM [Planctomycetaceae bacterium]MBP63389.1 flagellar biosynthesis protein FlgM [Planctomycetaceae bacterium]